MKINEILQEGVLGGVLGALGTFAGGAVKGAIKGAAGVAAPETTAALSGLKKAQQQSQHSAFSKELDRPDAAEQLKISRLSSILKTPVTPNTRMGDIPVPNNYKLKFQSSLQPANLRPWYFKYPTGNYTVSHDSLGQYEAAAASSDEDQLDGIAIKDIIPNSVDVISTIQKTADKK